MALLGFTVFREKILAKSKRQTIRKLRKTPIKKGETLHLYWHLRRSDCESLGSWTCTETFFVTICGRNTFLYSDGRSDPHLLSDEEIADLAKRDGFNNVDELLVALAKMHKDWQGQVFQVLRW